MPGKKISQLSSSLAPMLSAEVPIVQTGTTYKTTLRLLRHTLVDSGSHVFTGSQTINGGLFVSNSVTAAFFVGDGSQLTNINATNTDVSMFLSSSMFENASSSFDQRINDISNTGTPTGTISGSLQISDLGYATTSSLDGLVSGSPQISYTGITDTPDPVDVSMFLSSSTFEDVSSSFDQRLNNVNVTLPDGLVSGSSQISYTGITDTPGALDVSMFLSSSVFESFTSTFADISSSIDQRLIDATNEQDLSNFIDSTTYSTHSGSFDQRINDLSNSGVPTGTISGSLQISDLGFATTSSLDGLVSGSPQISYTGITDTPDPVDVSMFLSSSIFDNVSSSFDDRINDIANTGVPHGTVSGSMQLDEMGYATTSSLDGLVSGSPQISYTGITDVPSGLVSSSLQINEFGFATTASFEGLISGSEQISYTGITDTPTNLISGSSQIEYSGITGIPDATDVSMFLSSSAFESFTSSYDTTSGSFDGRIEDLVSQTSSYITEIPIASLISSGPTSPGTGVSANEDNVTIGFSEANDYIFTRTGFTFPDGTSQITAYTGLTDGLVSGSSQISYTGITDTPDPVDVSMFLSSSAFETFTGSYNNDSASFDDRINDLAISGVPHGTVSGSAQLDEMGYATTASLDGLVSGSPQISYTGITDVPSGIVSGSSQISYSGLTGVPSGLISGSSQLPSGLLSGSSQVNHDTTLNFVANKHIDHTSVTISGTTGLLGGGDITTSRNLSLDTASATFTNGVKTKMNTDGVISGSLQIQSLGFITGSGGNVTVNNLSANTVTATQYIVSSSVYYVTESSVSGSSSHGNTLDDVHNYTGSVNISGSLNISGSIGADLWQLRDVNDVASGSITNGYQLAWNTSTNLWEPTPGAAAKGAIRIFVAENASNANVFYFNAVQVTALSSASPGRDTAFMLTSNLLTTVRLYLRSDQNNSNSVRVDLFKNATGQAFATATSSIANVTNTLTQYNVVTYTFSGLTLNQFDSIHVRVTPSLNPGNLYGIITIE